MYGTTTTYTYSGNLLMEMHRSGKTLQFVYDAGGTALGFKAKETGTMYYYVRNAQGDIDRIVDANGSNRAQYTYDAWGFVVSQSSNDTYAAMNPFRYRGYMYDPEIGWYFLQTRYYDPMVKRFVNADSLFVAGDAINGANMYAYCNGNPVMWSDPSGMRPSKEDFQMMGTLIAGFLMIAENLAQFNFGLSIWSKNSKTQDFLKGAFEGLFDAAGELASYVQRYPIDLGLTQTLMSALIEISKESTIGALVRVVNDYTDLLIDWPDIMEMAWPDTSFDWGRAANAGLEGAMMGTASALAAAFAGPIAPVVLIAEMGVGFVIGFIGDAINQRKK